MRASEVAIVYHALWGKRVNCFLGEPSRRRPIHCPATPRTAAPPCAALSRPARGMSGLWAPQIPGHALHEKGLQIQKGVGPLVSSQEQRALLVPRINNLSTACQPVVVFLSSIGLNMISLVRASAGTIRNCAYDSLEGARDARLL